MSQPALVAEITGAAYRDMLEWRDTVDLQLIGWALERAGSALVIRYEGDSWHMAQVTELPARGTARPHSGPFGGGYEFCFFHTPAGWMLRVTNRVQASLRFQIDPPIPPLVLNDTDAIRVDLREVDGAAAVSGLMDDSSSDRRPSDRATFAIAGQDYERLVAAGWEAFALPAYEYCFFPLSVGCDIAATHAASGERIHVTRDVGW